ncbi:MAG: rRNA maturation RNase YbeY [Planctomycetota bacterium]
MSAFDVQISNRQSAYPIDNDLIDAAVSETLRLEQIEEAEISVGILNDAQIRPINREFLDHDWATDAISFTFDDDPSKLAGEVLVSAETAARVSTQVGWPMMHELILYVIHGTLHLTGHDDQQASARQQMRNCEAVVLARLGIAMPDAAAVNPDAPPVPQRDRSS